jgi:hypothetical protein
MGEKWPRDFSRNWRLPRHFCVLLHAVKHDMGQTVLLPLRRKACWGFFHPKNLTASAGFEPANFGTKGQQATPRPPKLQNVLPITVFLANYRSGRSAGMTVAVQRICTNIISLLLFNVCCCIARDIFQQVISSTDNYPLFVPKFYTKTPSMRVLNPVHARFPQPFDA